MSQDLTLAQVKGGATVLDQTTLVLQTGEIREVPKTFRSITLIGATDANNVAISFTGSNFSPLVFGFTISDLLCDRFWIQNNSLAQNTINIALSECRVTDNRSLASGLVQAVSSTDGALVTLGATTDAAAAGDSTNASLMAHVKRLEAKIPVKGQAAMAASVPVAIASDQSPLQVVGTVAAGSGIGVSAPVMHGVSDGTNVQRMHGDTAGNAMVVGPAANGAAVSGNPVRVGGSDGTTTRDILTDAGGRLITVGAVAAGSAIGTTAPVLLGASDSTNVQRVRSDTSGNIQVVGTVAAGSAVGTTAPVMMAGSDGTNVQRLSVTADNIATPAAGNLNVIGGLYNSSARALTSGRNGFLSIDRGGKVLTTPCGTLDPALAGYTVTTLDAAASTNAAFIKASAGMVYEVSAVNNAAYDVFIRLYNKASAPTVGTDVAYRVVRAPAGQSVTVTFPGGAYFSTGIAYATTKLVAYNDATALVAHDVQLSIQTA